MKYYNSLPEYNGSNQSFTFILIVADQIFQFVGVYNNMETAHLGQPELSVVHTGEADLLPGSGAVGLPGTVHGSLNSSYNKLVFTKPCVWEQKNGQDTQVSNMGLVIRDHCFRGPKGHKSEQKAIQVVGI